MMLMVVKQTYKKRGKNKKTVVISWIASSQLLKRFRPSSNHFPFLSHYRRVGLVVKASASGAEDPGFESRLRREFAGIESYQ